MTVVNLKVRSFKHRVEYLVKAVKMMFTGEIQFEYSVIDKSKAESKISLKDFKDAYFSKDKKFNDAYEELEKHFK